MLSDNKANNIQLLMIERGETLAVAESVASGYVQAITYHHQLLCSRLLTSEKNAKPAAQIDYAEQVLFQFEQALQQLAQRVTPV